MTSLNCLLILDSYKIGFFGIVIDTTYFNNQNFYGLSIWLRVSYLWPANKYESP